jgi:DNA-binding LacI/PurR family transcriptional regulator
MSWLKLFGQAGCLTDEQQKKADAAVHDYATALQKSLAEAGYYREEVDGVYGPSTVDAVKALQKKNGLPVTGALRALGRSAPRDLAVIGVDNKPLARFMSPSLSTIDQNHLLVATKLARLVFSGLAGEAAPAFEHSDALSLIVREST